LQLTLILTWPYKLWNLWFKIITKLSCR
jgi:hypothetical protein